MKKYYVKDADGDEYEVREEEVQEAAENPAPAEEPIVLTNDELKALKDLAGIAPQLMALLNAQNEEHEDIKEAEKEALDSTEEEEVIDTDEEEDDKKKMACDSKASFGAIEKTNKRVDDSLEDEVSAAWSKRYNGGNK